MTENIDKKNKLDAIMARLRVTYIQELPERVTSLEELVLKLEETEVFAEIYQKLFREVHSLKGSGGTYGFPIITTICHQMEDVLKEIGESHKNLSQGHIDTLLQYIDLFRQVPVHLESGDTELSGIESELNKLKSKVLGGSYRCLLVEGSVTTQTMVSLVLNDEQIEISHASNGIDALERLLQEKFDLLITAMATGSLNGKALIAATRLSDSVNAGIPAILLTTSEATSVTDMISANVTINKGPDMPSSLLQACRDLL